MAFLNKQMQLLSQYKEYSKYLQKRVHLRVGTASFYAKQIQDFTESGLTPKEYYERINKRDQRASSTFLINFREYNQFTTEQYFDGLDQLRWELGRKQRRGQI